MGIYISLIFLVFILAPLNNINLSCINRVVSGRCLYTSVIFTILFLVMGLRAPTIGTDTMIYQNMFVNISNAYSLQEAFEVSSINAPIYVTYAYLLGKIFSNTQIVTILNSFIICIGIASFIIKSKSNVVLSTFMFIALNAYFESFNGARQYMAIALMMNAYLYLNEGKNKLGLSLLVLSLGIHSTAAFFLPALCVSVFLKYNSIKKSIFISSIISIVIAFGLLYFLQIFLFLFPNYAMYIDGSNPANILVNSGGGRIVLLYCSFFIYLVFYCIKFWNIDSNEHLAYIFPVLFCIILGIIFSKNILINRLLWYYCALLIIFIPKVVYELPYRFRFFLYINTVIIYGIYCMLNLLENKSDIVPYLIF